MVRMLRAVKYMPGSPTTIASAICSANGSSCGHHDAPRAIARPAIADRRLSISPQGRVRYEPKTPWRNGTTHVEFEPIDFIAKLAALVPPPRAHLTRFHSIFAPRASTARAGRVMLG
jgi:hypothetical protein